MSSEITTEVMSRQRNEVCAVCGAISSEGFCGRCERNLEELERVESWIDAQIEANKRGA